MGHFGVLWKRKQKVIVLLRPPSSDLVTDAQGHTPQGNILWIQGRSRGQPIHVIIQAISKIILELPY